MNKVDKIHTLDISMSYTILTRDCMVHLIKKVRDYMEKGWIPVGGVAISNASGVEYFYQAMINKNHPSQLS